MSFEAVQENSQY